MSRIVDITGKFEDSKPCIKIGDKQYAVDNSLKNVLAFEEAARAGASMQVMLGVIKVTIGDTAYEEIGVDSLSINNFKVLMNAIGAVIRDCDYEEVEKETNPS